MFQKKKQKNTHPTLSFEVLSKKKTKTSKQLKKFYLKNLPSEKTLEKHSRIRSVASYQPNDCGWSYQNLPVQHTINGG